MSGGVRARPQKLLEQTPRGLQGCLKKGGEASQGALGAPEKVPPRRRGRAVLISAGFCLRVCLCVCRRALACVCVSRVRVSGKGVSEAFVHTCVPATLRPHLLQVHHGL